MPTVPRSGRTVETKTSPAFTVFRARLGALLGKALSLSGRQQEAIKRLEEALEISGKEGLEAARARSPRRLLNEPATSYLVERHQRLELPAKDSEGANLTNAL